MSGLEIALFVYAIVLTLLVGGLAGALIVANQELRRRS